MTENLDRDQLSDLSLKHFRAARELRNAGRLEEAEKEEGLSYYYSKCAEDATRERGKHNERRGLGFFLSGLLVIPVTLALVDKPLAGAPYVLAAVLIGIGLYVANK